MGLNKEQHRNRHKTLHLMFDELYADFIKHTGKRSNAPILDLMQWSHQQTIEPDHEEPGGYGEYPA